MPGVDSSGQDLQINSAGSERAPSAPGLPSSNYGSHPGATSNFTEANGTGIFSEIAPADVLLAMRHHHEELRKMFISGLCGALNLNFDIVNAFSQRDSATVSGGSESPKMSRFTKAQDRYDDEKRITIRELSDQATYEVFALGYRETFSAEQLAVLAQQVKAIERLINANLPNLQDRAATMSDQDLARELCATVAEIEKRTTPNRLKGLKSRNEGELAEYMNLCTERDICQAELSSRFNQIVNKSVCEFGGRAARDLLCDEWQGLNGTINPLAFWKTIRLASELSQIENFGTERLRQGLFALTKHNRGDHREARCQIALNLIYRLAKMSAQEPFEQTA